MRGDESMRATGIGLYVLAAVLVPEPAEDAVREHLRGVLPPRQTRFHWRNERDPLRAKMIETVAELELPGLVTVATPIDPKRQERARRHCLRRLLRELDQRQVGQVLLESRQNRDADDRSAIGYAQRAGELSRELRYSFGRPREEPLLCLPDAVAGAVAMALGDGINEYFALLAGQVSIVYSEHRAH